MFGVFKHLNFWEAVALAKDSGGGGGGGSDRPSTSSRTNSGDRIRVSQPTGGRGSESVFRTDGGTKAKPKNSAVDDFLMDIGAKPKNDVYYRDLADRSARSQAAMQQAMRSSDNDSGSSRATTTDTSTDTETTTTTTGTDTVLDQTTDAALDTVEDISTQTFTDSADFTGNVTAGASVGTAAGGVEQYEAAKETSVGQAEDEALELMKKGRRATILTKAGGLLGAGEQERKTRRRRSLIGG
jgi:hypothetical protein